METPAVFHDKETIYRADTGEPLKAAAKRGEVYLRAWSRGGYPGLRLPKRSLVEVRSIGIWDAPHHQSWGLDMHCNEGIEFTYLAGGQVGFIVDGKSWTLRQGYLTITRPWQFHKVGTPIVTASRLYWLILDVNVRRPNQAWQWPEWLICCDDELKQLTNLLSQNERPVWLANDEIARCFNKLAELLVNDKPEGSETKLKLYINELLIAVMEMLQQRCIPLEKHLTTSHRAVEMFLEGLSQHVGYDWDLNTMARQCGLSRSQFSTYCKQITSMTPIEYLTHCRIETAAQLLLDYPSMKITEVAFDCGFHSSQYFATVFRAFKGSSPRKFRHQS